MYSTDDSPEFDSLAHDYSAGCDARLKALIGSSPERFLSAKLDLLLPWLASTGISDKDQDLRLLDYGCGTGDLLRSLQQRAVRWRMEGCDVSQGMLREAAKRYPHLVGTATLWNCASSPVPPASYDLITVVCVLHHIPPTSWQDKLDELWSGLRPGGSLCVIEHNPRNPITRFMVAREPIDRNAVLMDQATLVSSLARVGCAQVSVMNFLFFPPNVPFLPRIERRLASVPWGGQYMAIATKPNPSGRASGPGSVGAV